MPGNNRTTLLTAVCRSKSPVEARAQTLTWTQRPVSGPSPRYLHAMAYDPARAVTVLFGGDTAAGDTWAWNRAAWAQRSAGGPSSPYAHAMAYSAARAATVLFGASATRTCYHGEASEWSG